MARRYDSRTTIFSPEGRLYQVEYAMEAISNAGAAVGILSKEGVVLAAEKRITSKVPHPPPPLRGALACQQPPQLPNTVCLARIRCQFETPGRIYSKQSTNQISRLDVSCQDTRILRPVHGGVSLI